MRNNFNWYDVRSNPEMDKYIEKTNKLLQSTQSGEWDNVRSDENGNTILNYTPPKGDICLIEENSRKEYDSSEIDKNKDIEKLKKLLQSEELYKGPSEDYEKQGKKDPKEEDTSSGGDKLDQKWGGLDKRYADDLFYAGSEKGEIVETDEYAIEKLDSMKDKFNFIVENLDSISSLMLDANASGIEIRTLSGYFDFARFYNYHMKEIEGQEKLDFTDFIHNISEFHQALQHAVHDWQNQPRNENLFFMKMKKSDIEKINRMKEDFQYIVELLGRIKSNLFEANAWGLNEKELNGYFDFADFYNHHIKEIEGQEKFNFTELIHNLHKFCRELEHEVI